MASLATKDTPSPAKPGRAVSSHGDATEGIALSSPPTTDVELGPPYTPRPRPQQQWVHSCCTVKQLEKALANSNVSAIEADIMFGHLTVGHTAGGSSSRTSSTASNGHSNGAPPMTPEKGNRAASLGSNNGGGSSSKIPIMAHPTWRKTIPSMVDLSFDEFLERCIVDGTRHLKLDFKDLDAVEPCLELLAAKWPQLHSNGQAIWLNADILPGPNARHAGAVRVPADVFVPLCRRLCPHAVLSLGWCVGPLGAEEKYTDADVEAMRRVCVDYDLPGSAVVFASSLRLSERAITTVAHLLTCVADSQLLMWTGTGELPVHPTTYHRVHMELSRLGHTERVGYDVQVARGCCSLTSAHAIDCTFFWSRWSRWLCSGPTTACCPRLMRPISGSIGASAGERAPLVIERDNGMLTPNITSTPSSRSITSGEMPSVPERMPSNGGSSSSC